MNERFAEQVEDAKTHILAMLRRMDEGSLPARYLPSRIWRDTLALTDYLFRLWADDFRQIRYHCDLFTGRDLIRYMHSWPAPDPQTDIRARMYSLCIDGLPDSFCLSEPECPALPFVPGVRTGSRIVNGSIVRYQLCASYLYRSGIAQAIAARNTRSAIVEIGGGHGGLAHGLHRAFDGKVCCVLVDLPQMLLFQIPFIQLNNPGARCYVYDETTFTPAFIRDMLPEYDFVFLPNFALPALRQMPDIALLLNVISFQEMTPEQVEEYLEFAQTATAFGLYSDNYDCHPHNDSGLDSITDRLEKRFSLHPAPAAYWDTRSPRGKIEHYGQFRRFLALNPQAPFQPDKEAQAALVDLEEQIRQLHAAK